MERGVVTRFYSISESRQSTKDTLEDINEILSDVVLREFEIKITRQICMTWARGRGFGLSSGEWKIGSFSSSLVTVERVQLHLLTFS